MTALKMRDCCQSCQAEGGAEGGRGGREGGRGEREGGREEEN